MFVENACSGWYSASFGIGRDANPLFSECVGKSEGGVPPWVVDSAPVGFGFGVDRDSALDDDGVAPPSMRQDFYFDSKLLLDRPLADAFFQNLCLSWLTKNRLNGLKIHFGSEFLFLFLVVVLCFRWCFAYVFAYFGGFFLPNMSYKIFLVKSSFFLL